MPIFVKKSLGAFLALTFVLAAWAGFPKGAIAREGGAWKWGAEVETTLTYDTNVYQLSSSQIDRLEADSAVDQTSGRFNDMESAGDLILSPVFKATFKRDGLGGNKFKLRPSIGYDVYAQNSKKNHFDLGITAAHNIGAGNSLSLEVDLAFNVFKKNYLSDATDLTGSVTEDERVYKPGVYDDSAIALSYRHRLKKLGKTEAASTIDKLYAEVTMGLEKRVYDAPFSNRDADTVVLGAGLEFELVNRYDVEISYTLEFIDIPGNEEVMIRDETDVGVDLNSNGFATDQNIRTVQKVDRSHTDQTLAVEVSTDFNKDWTGWAAYDLRFQDYKSKERFDITRLDREDTRHRVTLGVERDLTKDWSLAFEWRWAREKAGRDALAGTDEDESKSYSGQTIMLALTYEL